VGYFFGFVGGIVGIAFVALVPFFLVLLSGEFFLSRVSLGRASRFVLVMVKSLRRNLLRTSLTYLATFVLVIVVVLVWSVLSFLDVLTAEKTKDVKVIISEKWQANSQMPFAYAGPLSDGAADPSRLQDVRPDDAMTWQFYVGTLDRDKRTRESLVFFIALDPLKAPTMLDELVDDFRPDESKHRRNPRLVQVDAFKPIIEEMLRNKRAVVMGRERLEAINKRVGERFSLTGINYTNIDLEFEIVGVFPEGRYNQSAIMNRDYLNDALNAYPKSHNGANHPLVDKSLNLVWLKVPSLRTFNRITEQIDSSGYFNSPPVKCETLSSGVASWLDGYRSLIWGMRWLLSPAVLATMALVLGNAISIGVRERRMEMAVLKVLGFRPAQILFMILGEGALIGGISGFLSAGLIYLFIDEIMSRFTSIGIFVPDSALWWGPALGASAALAGSFAPAWTACRIKVFEVFARTA
jgi:putative ABC transport system permease protein